MVSRAVADFTIELPNVRKFFVPDPGYMMADFDLVGADAQVVTWEADDADLKEAFRKGLKLHAENAKMIFGADAGPDGKREPYYHQCKQGIHLTNYGGSAYTLAMTLGWTIKKSEWFQKRWFSMHPGIPAWHRRTQRHLNGEQCWMCDSRGIDTVKRKCVNCGVTVGRTVRNKFGYRRIYFDRIEQLLPQALAWIPQSTVALVSMKGALQAQRECQWAKLLLQVHDSLVYQYPIARKRDVQELHQALHVPIPYDDPLIIPWNYGTSDRSWGDCKED